MIGPIVTVWHRSVSVALWMAEMITGSLPAAPGIVPPYCSNPVPVSLVAVIRYSSPETEMLEAMAPWAVSAMSAAAMRAPGTATIANRRHLTLPCVLLLSTDMALPFGLSVVCAHHRTAGAAR